MILYKLKKLEREEISLKKILDDLKRVEGARDISDLEKKIKLTFDLQQAEVELEDARVASADAEAERDAFVSQFKQQSIIDRINAEEQAALQQLDAYEEDIDNFYMYQKQKTEIQNYFAEERAKYMMNETFILERDDYRDFTNRVMILQSRNEEAPYIVEHDYILDTFEVTLLDNRYTLQTIMEKTQ